MIAALFVRRNSIYKTMPGVDAWDSKRDAMKWPGGTALIAHPPCAQWGQLAHMARVNAAEKFMGKWSIQQVRKFGGVVEHPSKSKLWAAMGCAAPGRRPDKFGGWTLPISQSWFGHNAEKPTFLYIVGVIPFDLPNLPLLLGEARATVGRSGLQNDGTRNRRRKEIPKSQREATPPLLAQWLLQLCQLVRA